jgi:hypothetical protein
MRANAKKMRPDVEQKGYADLSGPLREARESALSGEAHHLRPERLLP